MLKSILRTFFQVGGRHFSTPPLEALPDGAIISTISTAHGSRMIFDSTRHALINCHPGEGILGSEVVALRHEEKPDLVLLLSPDGNFARPFRLEAQDDRFSLRDVQSHLYVSAHPPDPVGSIDIDRDQAGGWERFDLSPLTAPGAAQAKSAASFWDIFTTQPDARTLLDSLAANRWPAAKFRCYADMLDLEQCREFSLLSEGRPEVLKSLADIYPDDLWAQVALPMLARWLPDRQSAVCPDTVGTEFDFLAEEFDASVASFAKTINALARQSVIPSKKACVLATARNEGVYIVDWVAHHLALGFEHFFIYSNNNEDSSDELLRHLAESGLVTFIDNVVSSGVPPQIKAYAHALQIDPRILDYEWVAVVDLDEFVHLEKERFPTIGAYVDWQASLGMDSVGLNWAIMLPGQKGRWVDEPVATRFSDAFADVHVKSIFKPKYFTSSHCHVPNRLRDDVKTFGTADGIPCERSPFNTTPTFESAWIAHYYYKSAEEFLERRTKNRGDHPVMLDADEAQISTDAVVAFLDAFDRVGTLLLPESVPSPEYTAHVKATLYALPGIADAMQHILAQQRINLTVLGERLAASARFQNRDNPEWRLYALACLR